MDVQWTVKNFGDGRTLETAWYDNIYMSDDETLDGSDRLLGQRFHSGSLNPDESYSATQTVQLPVGVSGNFYFFVQTDVFNHVYEHAFENNNWNYDPDPDGVPGTEVLLTPPPDLEVEFVDAPSSALASHPLTISYRVVNFGSTETLNTAWTDSYYLSSDTVLDSADLPEQRDDESKPDRRFGCGDGDDEEHADLPVSRSQEVAEGHEPEVDGVQHHFDRQQHGDDVAPQQHACGPDGEQDARKDQVMVELSHG